jgi:hypothetical protein
LAEVGDSDLPGSAQPFGGGQKVIFGVAVDPSDGDVYASDINSAAKTGTVTKLDSSGAFQFQITGSETPQGSFLPFGVAVDPSNGDLYVADGVNEVIDRFNASGVYIEQFEVPVVAYSSTLSFGPEGNLYVGLVDEVREYSPTGAPVDCPGTGNGLSVEGGNGAVAVDPANGHIFASATSSAGYPVIAEYSSLCAVVPSRSFGEEELRGYGAKGIGVSGSTSDVYAGDFDADSALIFGLVSLPDVTTGASPTNVTRSSATVSGIVNPAGTPVTTCEFEYGTTESYGYTAPCVQALPLEGNDPLQVSAEIKLAVPPASLVYYRLKAGNGGGNSFGARRTFYLASLPRPVVGGLPASSVTQFGATLNGTLETGEALVDYRFEYGASGAYGSVAPTPDAYTQITDENVSVSEAVGNLQAGTTYHYRLVASSPGGTEVAGPDETFATPPIPAPAVGTGAASGVGVGAATLDGTIDPQGWQTSYEFQYGTTTAYGSSWPTVPVALGAFEGVQGVQVYVPNLLPGTTYHYRLLATNGGGTTYGPDMTFATGEYPAPAIQEPPALRTLLVPSGKVVQLPAKKKSKKSKKSKPGKKRKKPSRAGHGRAHKRDRKKK